MSDANETSERICAVCGRRLLTGERATAYVSREGAEVSVCELCKVRAEAAGWMRPGESTAPGANAGRRRRPRGDLLAGLLARSGQPRQEKAERADGRRRRGAGAEESPAPESQEATEPTPARASGRGAKPASEAPVRSAAGPDVSEAVAAFNGSSNRRTIAGLSRSLGEPKATAIAVRTAAGDTGARLTVAWELAWYQWEIGPGPRGPEVRQIAKGESIDQLRAADRNWNLEMAADGTLTRRRSPEA